MDPQYLIRVIMVNARGQRFINEDTYPGRIGQAALFQQDNRTFLVLDEEGFEEARRVSAAPDVLQLQPAWVCETASELAAETGLPPGALEATLEVYPPRGGRPGPAAAQGRALAASAARPAGCRGPPGHEVGLRPRRADHRYGRGGAACERGADPRPVRGGPGHGEYRRMGVRERRVARRRQPSSAAGRGGARR
jgi:hypothetical protein